MKRWFLFLLVSFFLVSSCAKRKDPTLERNIFTYLVNCTGGSLAACQAQCAALYPIVTGENYPQISACQSNCSNGCSVTNILLFATANR